MSSFNFTACIDNCESCSTSTTCSSCDDGYQLTSSFTKCTGTLKCKIITYIVLIFVWKNTQSS